jgi:hypothetical protein
MNLPLLDNPLISDHMNRFKAINVIAAGRVGELEYWNREDGQWEKVPPSVRHVHRVKSLFHEGSTTFMTESFVSQPEIGGPSVDKNYRPYGLENGNVYVTGAGLFPTTGSWNRMVLF